MEIAIYDQRKKEQKRKRQIENNYKKLENVKKGKKERKGSCGVRDREKASE